MVSGAGIFKVGKTKKKIKFDNLETTGLRGKILSQVDAGHKNVSTISKTMVLGVGVLKWRSKNQKKNGYLGNYWT
jgi:hypothetical protein